MTGRLDGLDDWAARNQARVGPKAATLAVLRAAGFRVPDAVVVPIDLTVAGEVTPEIRRAVAGLAGRLPPPWAVRSSALDEDGPGRSMAGQFTTTLRVEQAGLLDAVAVALASERTVGLDEPRQVKDSGGRPEGRVAVLIQTMADAVAAGVAMTRDPVTGTDEVVVEAVVGTSESLTAGAADPQRWRVALDGTVRRDDRVRPSDPVLDDTQVADVAALARDIARELGGPQDVEWALGRDQKLHVLQARPITGPPQAEVLSMPASHDEPPPPGHWSRDPFHEPIPVSRFGLELKQRQILDQFPRLFAEFGILLQGVEQVQVAGWYYHRPVPLVGPPTATRDTSPGAPPRWMLRLMLRLHPRLRSRAATARRVVDQDESMRILATWPATRDELAVDIDRALDLDLAGIDDAKLVAELDHRLDVISEAGWPHLQLMQAAFVILEEFFASCADLLGWERSDCLVLLDGLSQRSTEPSSLIDQLAERARSLPALESALEHAGTDLDPRELAEIDEGFATAFDAVVRRIGHRAPTYDVVEPTLAERPELLLAQVARRLGPDHDGATRRQEVDRRRQIAEQRARDLLAGTGDDAVADFDRALRRARTAYPIREDRVWETTSVQLALLRYLALEFGARLVRRDQLDRPDDVFNLAVPTVREALLCETDLRASGAEARRQRAHAIANPPPVSLGGPPSEPPPIELLPPQARLVHRAALRSAAQGQVTPTTGTALTGVAAATGRATGPVRLVTGPADLAGLRPGDVLVCRTASPTWSVVFPTVAALLSDTGGALSHTAIMAREHGVPAVLGLGDISTRVSQGQMVTVDGAAGTVHLRDSDLDGGTS